MNERSKLTSRLLRERDYRAAYIRAKLDVLVPSQLRALRLRQNKTQPVLAEMAEMKQSRISAMETPGKVNFNLDTLVRMAATLNVGMMVEFIPFSEMLAWENEYSQSIFNVTQLADDIDFLQPARSTVRKRARRKRTSRGVTSNVQIPHIRVTAAGLGAGTNMIPEQRERAQMKLQFEASERSSAQVLGEVITLPKRNRSVLNDLQKAAASVGVGRSAYGGR